MAIRASWLPIPSGGEQATYIFLPVFRLLGVGLVLSVLSEGRWGGEWTEFTSGAGVWALLEVRLLILPPVCTFLAASPACPGQVSIFDTAMRT